MPSLDWLRDSKALWRRRLAYRKRRLRYWQRREDRRHDAAGLVDKWEGLVDIAEARLRRRNRQIRAEREASRNRASEHFAIAEFACHDGTPVPPGSYDGLLDLCERVLEPMRRRFGACHVTSGYRHAAYNASIGGASRSYHIYDLRDDEVASDVTFETGTVAEWASYARRLGVGGVGEYRSSGFVHVDNGPRRDWWG